MTHPVRHLVRVRLPVVIVEDHDGGHHAARHHEHDAVEVGPYRQQGNSPSVHTYSGLTDSNKI